MRKKITIITALMLTFMLVFSTGSVYAKSLSEIKKEIKDKQQELEKGKSEEKELSSEIEELEKKIGAAENKMETLRNKIEDTEDKVVTAEADLKKAEEEVETQNENLNVRLRTMYKNGSIGFLDVLLGSGSISEFISNMDMVKKVYSSDKDVLADLQDDYDKIEAKKQELLSLQGQLESQKQEQLERQAELTADKKEVSKKKASVAASNAELEDDIHDLDAEADRIASIIKNDSSKNSGGGSGGSSYSSGKFTYPVPGYTRVSSDFGWRNCPFHGRELHSGTDFPAPYGTSVVAAASGTVVFSGYLGSYGNAVIISHGGGLYTLYGHNSSLVASSGAKVSKGQTIARIGSTGSSTGNHCHFEVRKGGNSRGNVVSPWNYLK
ncbi:peptidoglycan DD-metalloendopeptidase family protein [bacterium 210820-DFI.6.37]|nr:peptidoglycan DD-metalloendopeptidase family protein [bacterium 210820-DFI.6.37]